MLKYIAKGLDQPIHINGNKSNVLAEIKSPKDKRQCAQCTDPESRMIIERDRATIIKTRPILAVWKQFAFKDISV